MLRVLQAHELQTISSGLRFVDYQSSVYRAMIFTTANVRFINLTQMNTNMQVVLWSFVHCTSFLRESYIVCMHSRVCRLSSVEYRITLKISTLPCNQNCCLTTLTGKATKQAVKGKMYRTHDPTCRFYSEANHKTCRMSPKKT